MGYPALLPPPSSQVFPSDLHPLQPIPWCTEPRRQRLPTPGPCRLTHAQTHTHTHPHLALTHVRVLLSLTHTHTSLSCIYLPCLTSLSLPHREATLRSREKRGKHLLPCSDTLTVTQMFSQSRMTCQASAARPARPPHTQEGKVVWEPSSLGRIWLCSRV